MKKFNAKYICIALCVGILYVFFFSAMANITRTAINIISPEKLLSNSTPNLLAEYDWQGKYPFLEEDLSYEKNQTNPSMLNFDFKNTFPYKFMNKINTLVKSYTSEKIPYHMEIVSAKKKYDDIIGWNIALLTEYNSIVSLEDGYLVNYIPDIDTSPHINSVTNFDKFCKSKGIDFIYVQHPDKISKYIDTDINGVLDFANKRADSLIAGIEKNGVDYYDLREEVVADNLDHRKLFFKTDHHWKIETGLWAAQKITSHLKDIYGYDFDYEILSPDNFDKKVYHDFFLGSSGKKLTLSVSKPEDISFLYPKFETSLNYIIPDRNFDKTGDFSISYDESQIKNDDYYVDNPYGAYARGDFPLVHIKNHLVDNNTKVLVVKDSYANAVTPFFALVTENLDIIDLRYFVGSLKSYVSIHKPDIVVLMHQGKAIQPIDYAAHKSMFDLR